MIKKKGRKNTKERKREREREDLHCLYKKKKIHGTSKYFASGERAKDKEKKGVRIFFFQLCGKRSLF
jgi:hypothetical protein